MALISDRFTDGFDKEGDMRAISDNQDKRVRLTEYDKLPQPEVKSMKYSKKSSIS